jgi:hypothetical protein
MPLRNVINCNLLRNCISSLYRDCVSPKHKTTIENHLCFHLYGSGVFNNYAIGEKQNEVLSDIDIACFQREKSSYVKDIVFATDHVKNILGRHFRGTKFSIKLFSGSWDEIAPYHAHAWDSLNYGLFLFGNKQLASCFLDIPITASDIFDSLSISIWYSLSDVLYGMSSNSNALGLYIAKSLTRATIPLALHYGRKGLNDIERAEMLFERGMSEKLLADFSITDSHARLIYYATYSYLKKEPPFYGVDDIEKIAIIYILLLRQWSLHDIAETKRAIFIAFLNDCAMLYKNIVHQIGVRDFLDFSSSFEVFTRVHNVLSESFIKFFPSEENGSWRRYSLFNATMRQTILTRCQ